MNTLRWIFFLPGAVVASLIGALLGYYAGVSFGEIAAQTSAAFVGSLAFVLAAGIIAPVRRAGVTVVISSIVALVAGMAFVLSEFTNLEPYARMPETLKVLIPVAQLLGGIYANFWLQQLFATKLDSLLRKMRQLVWSLASLGLLLTTLGLAVGIVNRHWVGLSVGLGVLALAFVTWVLQKTNLLFSTRRALKQRTGA
jgi:hypothetical protein